MHALRIKLAEEGDSVEVAGEAGDMHDGETGAVALCSSSSHSLPVVDQHLPQRLVHAHRCSSDVKASVALIVTGKRVCLPVQQHFHYLLPAIIINYNLLLLLLLLLIIIIINININNKQTTTTTTTCYYNILLFLLLLLLLSFLLRAAPYLPAAIAR